MSKWVRTECKIIDNVDKTILEKALDKMRLQMDSSIKSISNPWGKDRVDCGLKHKNTNNALDIGFAFEKSKSGTKMKVVGDFYRTDYRDQTDFIDQLSAHYQIENVKDKASVNGYQIESEAVAQNGNTEIVLFSY